MNNPGYSGSIVLNDTTLINNLSQPIRCIAPITDCTFTTLTDTESRTNGVVTQSVGADYGTVSSPIYGKFTAIQLATGSAILYY